MTAHTFWKKLKRIGWLRHVPKEQHASLRALLKKNFESDPAFAYVGLTQPSFDAECIFGVGADEHFSYRRVLQDLAKDSRGLFQPTKLKDELIKRRKGGNAIKVSFYHHGLAFCCTVPILCDWFHEAVLDLVNVALKASGIEERFLKLPNTGQMVCLVLVPQRVFDMAILQGLIPWPRDIEV